MTSTLDLRFIVPPAAVENYVICIFFTATKNSGILNL